MCGLKKISLRVEILVIIKTNRLKIQKLFPHNYHTTKKTKLIASKNRINR